MAGGPQRLASGGATIDRGAPVRFTFDGRRLEGFAGDTLASALVANGIALVGRSFKYHRPRGLLGAGAEEPNGLVRLGTGAAAEPNTKATLVELHDGLVSSSQNRWPSLAFDVQAVNALLSPFFAAGFYYKTFMWPKSFWEKLYEPAIRRSAGLGRASGLPDPGRYDKVNAFCDVLVIGGGPAGLMAALAAGRAGARVILAEQDFVLGGRLLSERHEIDGMPSSAWAAQAAAELDGIPNVTVLRRAAVFGSYDSGTFGVIVSAAPGEPGPRQTLWKIVTRSAVLATGAIERPLVFGGNDKPGIMLASAVRSYVNRFAALPGQQITLFTATDEGWNTAVDIAAAGGRVVAILDTRREVSPQLRALAPAAARIFLGADIKAGRGRLRLTAIDVVDRDGRAERIATDCLAMAGGWTPMGGMATHLGGRLAWSERIGAPVPKSTPAIRIAGAAAGQLSLAESLASGAEAGLAAAEAAGHAAAAMAIPRSSDDVVTPFQRRPYAKTRRPAFVDFQNDVTAKDIALAVREGFAIPEHLKRYTTLGMGTDQGRTASLNAIEILADVTGHPSTELMPTSARPPETPIAIAALAGASRGEHFRPKRLPASHDWSAAHGGSFTEAGPWMRPRWYTRTGEADWLTTVNREVTTVRTCVGVCDVSTLGKLDLSGPDVAVFLDRVYTNLMSTVPVGKVRYGLMLREDGFVLDDGTAARLGETHFVISTTTANALRVTQHVEYCRQVLWPELDVSLVPVTDQWAQYAIAGPRSRDLLQALLGDRIDIGNAAFPYLAVKAFDWDGVEARLFRVSFSGELAYEIAVPASVGAAAFERLMEACVRLGGCAYGTEALGVMRIEKGHVAGSEINGQTTAADLGLGKMLSAKKDFVGKMLAQRPALAAADRPALVGLRPVDRAGRFSGGAHFLAPGATPSIEADEGWLTSVAFSPSLGHFIGLGFLRNGARRLGEQIRAYDPVRGRDTLVEVVPAAFVDPEGARLHV
ncbi:MAG: sarcosine oxidase subunit alpha family protein [Bauldia sp.]|nr:sarcosine oxidase subunit alpha family protein [Bauldia sp.]